jgi:hypothetical protein
MKTLNRLESYGFTANSRAAFTQGGLSFRVDGTQVNEDGTDLSLPSEPLPEPTPAPMPTPTETPEPTVEPTMAPTETPEPTPPST